MRTPKFILPVLLILTFILGGCGYYFPHVYDGPTKKVYMPTWNNRTSKLGLDAKLYQSLSRWFQKSDSIILTKKKEEADLILTGEIMSIDLPSVSWNANSRATEVNVRLVVRYVLKDMHTENLLWEVPRELWTEAYSTKGGSTVLADKENVALEQIISDISERIYLGTLEKLRKMNKEKK